MSCYYTGGLAEAQGFLLPLVNNYRLYQFATTLHDSFSVLIRTTF